MVKCLLIIPVKGPTHFGKCNIALFTLIQGIHNRFPNTQIMWERQKQSQCFLAHHNHILHGVNSHHCTTVSSEGSAVFYTQTTLGETQKQKNERLTKM